MDESEFLQRFQSFDCESVPLAENTPASPRPPHRPRRDAPVQTGFDGIFLSFDAEFVLAPPNTPATPRPPGRPREVPPAADPRDAALARELADRLLAHARANPAGLSAEQLAALVHQLVARRSA